MANEAADVLTTQDGSQISAEPEKVEAGNAGAPEGKETASSADATGDTKPEHKEGEEKPKRPGGFVRRALKAEAEADYWRRVASGEIKPAEAPAQQTGEKPQAKAKPTPKDFDNGDGTYDQEKYLEALADHVAEQKLEAYKATQQKQETEKTAKTESEKAQERWNAAEQSAVAKFADYEEVCATAAETLAAYRGTPGIQALAVAVQDSEAGPELLYYLGQNPDEVERLSGLQGTAVIRAIGKLEAKLESVAPQESAEKVEAPKPAPAPISKAPAPITPVSKPSAAADNGELRDDLPMREWDKRFRKKLEKRLNG